METRRVERAFAERRRRQRRRRSLLRWLIALGCVAVVALAVLFVLRGCDGGTADRVGEGFGGNVGTSLGSGGDSTQGAASAGSTTTTAASSGDGAGGSNSSGDGGATVTSGLDSTTSTIPGEQPGDVRVAGTFYGPINTQFAGLTMFRGNGSRTYYGEGPVPADPKILWKFGPMSGLSTDYGVTKTWTGTGWTGQPCVFEREGKTWVVFGAYDWKIHFLDGETGERLLPDFKGGDIFKGSAVVDPDGYPLIFMGCRDNKWRIIAIDRDEPTELFNLDADKLPRQVWNNDWDSSVVIRNDYAFVGGENGHFYILKLNRGYDAAGKVTVDPEIVLDFATWTQTLFDKLGDRNVSVENSPALVGDRVYFSNSGGFLHALDVSATLKELKPGERPATGEESYPVVFRYWTGDDTDATVVVDEEGYLYVAMELDRFLPRATEVGQIIKVDPRKNKPGEDPVVWSVPVTSLVDGKSGVYATVCLYKDMVYVPTQSGSLLALDRETGEVVWEKALSPHAWASCVVVDRTLIVGDTFGVLHAWDVSDTRVDPPVVWEYTLPSAGALESTVAVWEGRIYVGSRDGYFYCFGDE